MLAEYFVVGQHQTTRITTCIGLLHQFQIRSDVLVVDRNTMKLFEQIKDDAGFPFEQPASDDTRIIANAELLQIVTEFANGLANVVLCLPIEDFLVSPDAASER